MIVVVVGCWLMLVMWADERLRGDEADIAILTEPVFCPLCFVDSYGTLYNWIICKRGRHLL